VKKRLAGDKTGHDWWHVARVLRNALLIAENEGAVDLFVVRLAALLHDVADWKFVEGDDARGGVEARVWLEEAGVQGEVTDHVCQIVTDISFKGSGVEDRMNTPTGKRMARTRTQFMEDFLTRFLHEWEGP
jgi:uncharacterized protein